jgi:hypothetical protein
MYSFAPQVSIEILTVSVAKCDVVVWNSTVGL